jgi:hypothetical protein
MVKYNYKKLFMRLKMTTSSHSPKGSEGFLGQLTDPLGVTHRDFGTVTVETFNKFFKNKKAMSLFLEVSPQAVSKQKYIHLKPKIKDNVITLLRVISRIFPHFENDQEKTINWVCTPNEYFWGKSPFELIAVGEGSRVLELLDEQI